MKDLISKESVVKSRMMSKNTFKDMSNGVIAISGPGWARPAYASVKDDFIDELKSLTWAVKDKKYLYCSKLKMYLHQYMIKKWYGEEEFNQSRACDYAIDHLDNDGYNCRIENLYFLKKIENTVKGLGFDISNKCKSYISLSIYRDFETELFQIAIKFNYPAKAVMANLDKPAVIKNAMLLYDCDYKFLLNDAERILLWYGKDYSFRPEKLDFIDYHIEGEYREMMSLDEYNEYLKGKRGPTIIIYKKAFKKGWAKSDKEEYCCFE